MCVLRTQSRASTKLAVPGMNRISSVTLPAESVELLQVLGFLQLQNGNPRSAMTLLEACDHAGGCEGRSLILMALAQLRAGAPEKALSTLDRADPTALAQPSYRVVRAQAPGGDGTPRRGAPGHEDLRRHAFRLRLVIPSACQHPPPLMQAIRRIIAIATSRNDILLAATVMAIVFMMILPMPTAVMDVLIALNISLSCVLLMVAIYLPSALAFSSFPAVLLVSTLFRLGISISTTRLIPLRRRRRPYHRYLR